MYTEDDHRIAARQDRDVENEGLGRSTPYGRPRVTLIRKAAGALQPRLPERIVTTHDVGAARCDCRDCRKADPTREESPKVVKEMPLDGIFDHGGES